jgi:hypothetical protein
MWYISNPSTAKKKKKKTEREREKEIIGTSTRVEGKEESIE